MTSSHTDLILNAIRDANLSYLMLAQRLIRSDRQQALFHLGVSEETADMIAALSPAQILKVANCDTLLCQLRMDDELVGGCTQGLLMAGRRH